MKQTASAQKNTRRLIQGSSSIQRAARPEARAPHGSSAIQGPTLRGLLVRELNQRRSRNPNYSLRAFASFLEVSPSFLSKLMTGKRAVTEDMIERLSERLCLPAEITSVLREGLQASKGKPRAAGSGLGAELDGPSYRQLSLDQFQFIADWYHFALLELITVKGFDPSADWIATQLGITPTEASDAVERLIRLGFLERSKSGRLKLLSPDNSTIGPEIATSATRVLQTQLLDKAARAVEQTPIELRSQTAVTLAISQERLPEAREIIAEFRRKMASVLQRPGARDSVYQLTISFFPLTPNQTNKRKKS